MNLTLTASESLVAPDGCLVKPSHSIVLTWDEIKAARYPAYFLVAKAEGLGNEMLRHVEEMLAQGYRRL